MLAGINAVAADMNTEEAPAPLAAAKAPLLSTNVVEKAKTLVKMAAEAFKIVMACLLVVFVPQLCPETGTTCTASENFSNLTRFNTFCLVWNFLTLGAMVAMYAIEMRREWHIIENFDADKSKADNNWELEREGQPEMHATLQRHNNWLRFAALAVIGQLLVNFITSSVLIYYYYYDGFRSVTTLLANTFLVLGRVANCLTIGHASYSGGLALSSMLLEPVSFNTTDAGKAKKYKAATA